MDRGAAHVSVPLVSQYRMAYCIFPMDRVCVCGEKADDLPIQSNNMEVNYQIHSL